MLFWESFSGVRKDSEEREVEGRLSRNFPVRSCQQQAAQKADFCSISCSISCSADSAQQLCSWSWVLFPDPACAGLVPSGAGEQWVGSRNSGLGSRATGLTFCLTFWQDLPSSLRQEVLFLQRCVPHCPAYLMLEALTLTRWLYSSPAGSSTLGNVLLTICMKHVNSHALVLGSHINKHLKENAHLYF